MNFALTVMGLSSVILAAIPWWVEVATDPINTANYARIKVGMTEAEVVKILGSRDPDDDGIQREISGDFRSDVKCWSRPSLGAIRDTILVGFRLKDGQWTVENKYCFIPSPWDRMKAWLGGYELLPDRHLPHMPIGGRTKRLEEAA